MKDRIVSFERVAPCELADHPQNWREHPSNQQAALREVFERVGVVDAILAYRSASCGKLTIVDGHLRRQLLAGEEKVPVIVLDLTDEEAAAILASHDPVGAMATRNEDLFQRLVDEIAAADGFADIARMLDVDRWQAPEDAEADALFSQADGAAYDIAPVYDEGYDAVIITCATDSQWAQLRTLLDVPTVRDRRGRVGTSHVMSFEEFTKRWLSR